MCPGRAAVLFVSDGRSAESLSGFFDPLTASERARIEAVAMDMSGDLSAVTRALGPDAHERIVFDKYHLASLLGDAVNKVRREEHKTRSRNSERLKGTRHLFLISLEHVAGADELTQLKSSNLKVARAWAIKETFMDAFAFRQPKRAERALKEVLAWMARSRLAPMIGERSLRRAVFEFVAHYHHERNHQGLDNQLILPPATPGRPHGPIRCRHRLGGMLTYYYRPAPDQQPIRPRRHRCS